MNTVKVITNKESQTVRIPKSYRFDVDEVYVNKVGETLMLTPVSALGSVFDAGVSMLTEDFLAEEMPEPDSILSKEGES